MKRSIITLGAILFVILAGGRAGHSQQAQITNRINPQIDKILGEISAARIEASMRKLVAFGTRHTFSSQDDPARGIGAARRWIKEEFERYSRDSGGRLEVTEDEFIQQPTARVKQAVKVVNVVATLPGTQAEAKDQEKPKA